MAEESRSTVWLIVAFAVLFLGVMVFVSMNYRDKRDEQWLARALEQCTNDVCKDEVTQRHTVCFEQTVKPNLPTKQPKQTVLYKQYQTCMESPPQ